MFDEGHIVFGAVLLRHQHIVFASIPSPRPVFVGPAQAKGQIEAGIAQPVFQRCIQQALAAEPVEVAAEGAYAIVARQLHLPAQRVGLAEIIKAEVGGKPRLCVPFELRQSPRHVVPFREPRTPPRIVFRNRVKLRQIKSDQRRRGRVGPGMLSPWNVADSATGRMDVRTPFCSAVPVYLPSGLPGASAI